MISILTKNLNQKMKETAKFVGKVALGAILALVIYNKVIPMVIKPKAKI